MSPAVDHSSRNARRWLVASLGLLLSACASGAADDAADGGEAAGIDGGVFIALQTDFADFQSWTRFDIGSLPMDGTHIEGDRIVYVNQLPPHGSTRFPNGTIVVKTIGGFGADAGQTFAMAKRGGNYNLLGASGWEWFELAPSGDGTPVVVWRGITPPDGEGYGGAAGGACNNCHGSSRDNDHVLSEPLQLSRF